MVNKNDLITDGEIVMIPQGRRWLKAKVQQKLADGILKLKLKSGKEVEINSESVMTEDEAKAFRKSGGNTQIIRQQRKASTMMGENVEDSELNNAPEPEKKGKLFGLL